MYGKRVSRGSSMGCTARSTSSLTPIAAPRSIANATSGIVSGSTPFDHLRDNRDLNATTGTIRNNEFYYVN